MVNIKTTITHITFSKGDFAIMLTSDGFHVKGIVGDMDPTTLKNIKVGMVGDWEIDKTHGKQFKFKSLTVMEDPIFYFLNKVIRVPSESAREIANSLGDKVWDIIEKNPRLLINYKGIGEKTLIRILDKWEAHKDLLLLGKELGPLGISNDVIGKIYNHFGSLSLSVLKSNPYALIEVRGIGFKTADEVAQKMGINHDDPKRMKACATFCILELMDRTGNSALRINTVQEEMRNVLYTEEQEKISPEVCFEGIKNLLISQEASFVVTPLAGEEKKTLEERMHNNDYISASSMLFKEWFIYHAAQNAQSKGQVVDDIDTWIDQYEKRHKKQFGDEQKEAIRLANSLPGIFSISGYAGSGKTTTSKAILDLVGMQYSREDIACCALAGIAANRVKMQSGFESSTIHSLLKVDGKTNQFQYNAQNKLPQRVILLDEGSMVDSTMMSALFRAIDFDKTMLIILGDPAQLSPVGPGQPYSDFIENKIIPNVTLTKIYRQSEDKMITTLAGEVRQGIRPNITEKYDDFEFTDISIPNAREQRQTLSKDDFDILREQNHQKINNEIAILAKNEKRKLDRLLTKGNFWEYITKFQVAAPMRKGSLGIDQLNKNIQKILNPNPSGKMVIRDKIVGVGDKVVHLSNANMEVVRINAQSQFNFNHLSQEVTETARVFNGQLGIVVTANQDDLNVLYPIENMVVSYSNQEVFKGLIDLSYALTVHKTQGSEFHTFVMPMTNSYYLMLEPKLLYTAMTRAKEKLHIVGQSEAFSLACRQKEADKRVTCIQLWEKQKQLRLHPELVEPEAPKRKRHIF